MLMRFLWWAYYDADWRLKTFVGFLFTFLLMWTLLSAVVR